MIGGQNGGTIWAILGNARWQRWQRWLWVSKLGPTEKQQLDGSPGTHQRVRRELMIALVLAVIAYCRTFFIGRHRLGLEVAALRQQLVVFKRKQPRPHLCDLDRTFWVALRRLWPGWANALIIVKPDTVVSRHRAAFRLFLAMAVAA
jgi:hypothetical protein